MKPSERYSSTRSLQAEIEFLLELEVVGTEDILETDILFGSKYRFLCWQAWERKRGLWWRQSRVVIQISFTSPFFTSGTNHVLVSSPCPAVYSWLLVDFLFWFFWPDFLPHISGVSYFVQKSTLEFFRIIQSRPLARDLFIVYAR